MDFRIADTFTDSLGRLTGDEQKSVKTAAFDLQINPASPGMRFHRLDRGKDKNFWSVRVTSDLRIIVHRSESSLLLCFVGHHDRAYDWAERRKIEVHPTTGAAQLVEIRESVREVVVPVVKGGAAKETAREALEKALLFAERSDEDLLGYGVPSEWLTDVKVATEDSLFDLAPHLPAEAAEALLELATGGVPRVAAKAPLATPFDHPDAQRRFRVVESVAALEQALSEPWEKWTIFLHPEQRDLVEREFHGPARVAGSAGTGKTIVALHRAAHLARKHPDSRVLLATFSDPLAQALRTRLRRLIAAEPMLRERIDVSSLDALLLKLSKTHLRGTSLVDRGELLAFMTEEFAGHPPTKVSLDFLLSEWEHVVDAMGLETWDSYRDVVRLGRKTRLSEVRRREVWTIFEKVLERLRRKNQQTSSGMFRALASAVNQLSNPIFDFAVIDESQDLSPAQLTFCSALGGARPDSLFFAGDIGQRIFQQPFSWKALGVDVRGRSRVLRVNYRTSHQIRAQSDRLLSKVVRDVDGIESNRADTVSVFNGPAPTVSGFESPAAESVGVAAWISERLSGGSLPHEVGVFVRSTAEIPRALNAVARTSNKAQVLDEQPEPSVGRIAVGTMHLAKGLEFRSVVVMACDDEVIPLQSRIQSVGEEGDLQEVYDTERHLLYVACTRAREHLLVTGVIPASEFLDDLRG